MSTPQFDWTINVTSIVNLVMLLILCGTAVASYIKLQESTAMAHSYISDIRNTLVVVQSRVEGEQKERAAIQTQLEVISTKVDLLKEDVQGIEHKLP